jgi:hypothetical protein
VWGVGKIRLLNSCGRLGLEVASSGGLFKPKISSLKTKNYLAEFVRKIYNLLRAET